MDNNNLKNNKLNNDYEQYNYRIGDLFVGRIDLPRCYFALKSDIIGSIDDG